MWVFFYEQDLGFKLDTQDFFLCVVLYKPWIGRSVPGARGAQHTTNMAAALSKLPLRTNPPNPSFP